MISLKDNCLTVVKPGIGKVSLNFEAVKAMNKSDFSKTYGKVFHDHVDSVYAEVQKMKPTTKKGK